MKKLLFNLSIIFYLLLSFLITACSANTSFSPEKLPMAKLGQPYYAEIEIYSSPGPVMTESFGYFVKPENSGLNLKPIDAAVNFPYNHLKIEGIPNITGEIIIQFGGTTYGTSSSGSDFNKTYIIKVKELE